MLAFFLAFEPDRSHPVIGMEFLNSPFAPQTMHLPMLVCPFVLSIIHRCEQACAGSVCSGSGTVYASLRYGVAERSCAFFDGDVFHVGRPAV